MKKVKIIILLVLLLLQTGCWNYRELNEMAIVVSIGVDYDEENDLFVMSAQILNPKKSSGGESGSSLQESPIIVYKYSDKTIHESLRNMIYESPKKLYIGHLENVIFGKEVAEKHLAESLDFLFRDSESRKDFDLLVASEGTAYDILKIIPSFETTPAANIMSTIKSNSNYIGNVISITYDNFVSMVLKDGVEGVLPAIKIIRGTVEEGETIDNVKESETNTDFIVKNFVVFKKDKMLGELGEDESMGYNIISGKMKESVISFYCDKENNTASMEIIKLKPKIKIKIKKNIPNVSIDISGIAGISEVNCEINLTKNKNILKLTKMFEDKVVEIVKSALDQAKEFNSDIFGFGENLSKNNVKYWKKNKDKWYKIFPEIKYKIKAKIEVPQKGTATNSFKEKLK